jgi:uncharacterized protein YecT (DUF1311 family)
MANFKFIYSLVIFFFGYLAVSAQTLKTIASFEVQYQACLDKGQFMLGCAKTFYNEMDSLLNVRYKSLRSICDSVQKDNLRDEQLEWLSKKDKQFIENRRQVNRKAKRDGYAGGEIETMMLTETNANYVKQRVIQLIARSPKNYSAENYHINPTGFYFLDSKTETRNGETYGYFGDIAVKYISHNKVVVRLFVCKGAPSYSSGTVADTLTIINNKAIYRNAQFDSSCRIIFTFFRQGIKVEELANDYNFGCDFGHAVIADGYYKRKSNKTPSDKELTDG